MNGPSLEEVEKAILESATCMGHLKKKEHLEYLRDNMNDLGYSFPDSKAGSYDAYEMAIYYWWKIRERKNPIEKIPIKYLKDLPSTKVEIDGIEYYIHGINHGTGFGPILRASSSVKNFIKSIAKEYDNPSRNSKLLLEDGLKEKFDIKEGKEFNDHRFLDSSDKRNLHISNLLVPIVVMANFFVPKRRILVRESLKSLQDMSYLPRLGKYMKEFIFRNLLVWNTTMTMMIQNH